MPDQCATCGAADVLLFTCGYCDRQFCADHVRQHQTDSCEAATTTGDSDVNEEAAEFQWGATGKGTATATDAEPTDDDPFDEGGFRFEPVTEDAPAPRAPAADTAPVVTRAPRTPAEATEAVDRVPRDPPTDATPAIRPVPRPVTDATPATERLPRPVDAGAEPAVERAPRPTRAETEPAIGRVPRDTVGVHLRAVRRPAPRTPTGTATSAVRPATDPDPDPESTGPTGGVTADTATDGGAAAAAADAIPIRPMDMARSPGKVDRSEPRTTLDWIRQQTYVSLTVKTALLAAVINGALYFGMAVTINGLA